MTRDAIIDQLGKVKTLTRDINTRSVHGDVSEAAELPILPG